MYTRPFYPRTLYDPGPARSDGVPKGPGRREGISEGEGNGEGGEEVSDGQLGDEHLSKCKVLCYLLADYLKTSGMTGHTITGDR